MFTGLVEALGTLRSRTGGAVARMRLDVGDPWSLVLGESIAVDGVCLTVAAFGVGWFEADLSPETLARTTLGSLALGARVHLERATPAGGRLGGHVVLGHVDAVGHVTHVRRIDSTLTVCIRAPEALAPFLAEKGSVAVSGVSLTVNGVRDEGLGCDFDLTLVPHTLDKTWLAALREGARVNLEADVLARYVERQLRLARGATKETQHDDQRLLAKLRDGGWA